MKTRKICSYILLFSVLISAQSLFGQYTIPRSVFASGGGSSNNALYQLHGTVGTVISGRSANNSYALFLGFWYDEGILVGLEQLADLLPSEFRLFQNYPNPFNPVTKIKYAIPAATKVKIEVYNILGQRVLTLVDGYREAGYHTVSLNAENLSSNIYFYRIVTDYFIDIRKMIVSK